MNDLEERVRASVSARWAPTSPPPMPSDTLRAIRTRREARRWTAVAVAAGFVVAAAVAATTFGSRAERPADGSNTSVPPTPAWTYDDPSAWPVMAIDPSASPDEGLSDPDSAHFVEVRAIGTADGTPFALMTYVNTHDATCGELEVGAIDGAWSSVDGPMCSSGWVYEIPGDRSMLSVTDLDRNGDRRRQVMFAIVSASVDHLIVRTLDGHRAELPVFHVEGSDVGFAFVFVPPGSEGTVRAIGTEGQELDFAGLCYPWLIGDEPDVSAGCTGSLQGISDRETAQLSGAR
jgi:hypothetical protein